MKKICMISLDITSDTSYGLQKELALSSIKNDNTFVIQNSIDYFKEEEAPNMTLNEATQNRIHKLNNTEFHKLPDHSEAFVPITLA